LRDVPAGVHETDDVYAAAHGNYGPVIAAAVAVIVAVFSGLDAFGMITRLSRWITSDSVSASAR